MSQAFYNDVAIGSITSREEIHHGKKYAYIMTFGVLQPYRRLGFGTNNLSLSLGSQLLEELLALIKKNPEIRAIYLHMWTNNQEGYKFYLSQGFE
jgi:ribosomal protein S18 acetylase RimI-like enzyme